MPNPVIVRERRRRKSKAQLIDELESFERRVAALEVGRDGNASGGGKPPSRDDYLANQALLDLAKFQRLGSPSSTAVITSSPLR